MRTVFEFLAKVRPGSRIVFTYIAKNFIDGERTYGMGRTDTVTEIERMVYAEKATTLPGPQ